MRTALVLLSVLLFQVVGGGVILSQAPESGTAGALAPGRQPAVSGTFGTPPASSHAPEDALLNRIAHLTIGESSRDRLATQSLNVTAAVSIGRDDAAARLEDYAFEERLREAGDPVAAIETELDAIEAEVDALRASKRALWRQYANGSIPTARYVRATARLQASALGLRIRLSGVREAVDRQAAETLVTRVEALEHELLGLGGPHREQGLLGPVRGRALSAIRGTEESVDLYAAGSEHGFVFATISGSEYVREAYRADDHGSTDAAFSLTQAAERARTLYPVAFNVTVSLGYGISGLGRSDYLLQSDVPFGSLRSYLDGTTRNVFFETQRRDLDRMVQPASVTARANGTRLIVNRSYPGGPLRVAVLDNATGTPVESTVRVGETRHATGPDGVVWALTPPRAVFTVRAIRPAGNVTVNARPLSPTPLNRSS